MFSGRDDLMVMMMLITVKHCGAVCPWLLLFYRDVMQCVISVICSGKRFEIGFIVGMWNFDC